MTAVGGPRVVAIGGGHGLAMTLRSVRDFACEVTAVVAVGDDGGSSGRLRADLGIAPPGDLRRCLSSVTPDDEVAELLEHRFARGELAGHPVGNVLLAGLVDRGLTTTEAVAFLARRFEIDESVRILPVVDEPVTLSGTTAAGSVSGQVGVQESGGVTRLHFTPPDPPVPEPVLASIAAADLVVLGPGSLFTSVLAAAAVPQVVDALGSTRARIAHVCNLRSDDAEAFGYDVAGHLDALRSHGIRPHVVVVQDGGLAEGDVGDIEVVRAIVDRPHGLAHDPSLLGAVLATLV